MRQKTPHSCEPACIRSGQLDHRPIAAEQKPRWPEVAEQMTDVGLKVGFAPWNGGPGHKARKLAHHVGQTGKLFDGTAPGIEQVVANSRLSGMVQHKHRIRTPPYKLDRGRQLILGHTDVKRQLTLAERLHAGHELGTQTETSVAFALDR